MINRRVSYLTWPWTLWPPGDVAVIWEAYFSNALYKTVLLALTAKFLSEECHRTSLMRNQHWFRKWLGAVRRQAIIRANVDRDLFRRMASPVHNELITRFFFSEGTTCDFYVFVVLWTSHYPAVHYHIETETKWPPFRSRHFQMLFLEWKRLNFD